MILIVLVLYKLQFRVETWIRIRLICAFNNDCCKGIRWERHFRKRFGVIWPLPWRRAAGFRSAFFGSLSTGSSRTSNDHKNIDSKLVTIIVIVLVKWWYIHKIVIMTIVNAFRFTGIGRHLSKSSRHSFWTMFWSKCSRLRRRIRVGNPIWSIWTGLKAVIWILNLVPSFL